MFLHLYYLQLDPTPDTFSSSAKRNEEDSIPNTGASLLGNRGVYLTFNCNAETIPRSRKKKKTARLCSFAASDFFSLFMSWTNIAHSPWKFIYLCTSLSSVQCAPIGKQNRRSASYGKVNLAIRCVTFAYVWAASLAVVWPFLETNEKKGIASTGIYNARLILGCSVYNSADLAKDKQSLPIFSSFYFSFPTYF